MKNTLKNLLVAFLFFLSFSAQAQFINWGIHAGAGVGGPQTEGLNASTFSPELGVFLKYNYLDHLSFYSTINVNQKRIHLREGRQVNVDYTSGIPTISDAPNYKISSFGCVQHVMAAYSFMDDKLSVAAGAFWGINFWPRTPYGQPRYFYNASDARLLEYRDSPSVYNPDSYEVDILASDQILEGLQGVDKGLSAAVSAGNDRFRVLLRYDFSPKNHYKKFSEQIRISQNYVKASFVYFLN